MPLPLHVGLDWPKILETMAGGCGTALAGWLLGRGPAKRKETLDHVTALWSRVENLERRTDQQDRDIAELRSQKIQLESELALCKNRITTLAAEKELYLQNEAMFRVKIAESEELLAAEKEKRACVEEKLAEVIQQLAESQKGLF